MQQFTKQHAIDQLNRLGLSELADEASRNLPDPVCRDQLEAWGMRSGLSYDEIVTRMGGSP